MAKGNSLDMIYDSVARIVEKKYSIALNRQGQTGQFTITGPRTSAKSSASKKTASLKSAAASPSKK